MSNYSAPITQTGAAVNWDATQGGIIDSLIAELSPTQDLHGYSKPWAAGAGKNLLDASTVFVYATCYEVNADGSVTVKATNGLGWTNANVIAVHLTAGTYTFSRSTASGAVQIRSSLNSYGSNILSLANGAASGSFTLSADADIKIKPNTGSTATYPNTSFFQIEAGSPATSWEPYSNVCPITGNTTANAYISPTVNLSDATTYTASFSTVYGGTVDFVTGELKARPYYASYNGETLTGPWISSLDEYVAGQTPTVGAEVVDLGGTMTTTTITGQTVAMLTGHNVAWVSTGNITITYRLEITAWVSGSTSIGKNAGSLVVSQQFNGYSKVVVQVTEELYYEAGTDTGRTLTVDCPWGTQAVANNLLTLLQGFQYQPYEAEDAILDPAAELGDGLTVNGVYGGIFKLTLRAGALHAVSVSSPQDEEIEHEYQFIPASERKIERQLANVQSQLSVQASEISAKVDREGGDPSSVEWVIDADQFVIKADGTDVLTVDENGLTVNGDGNFTGEVHAGNIKYGGSSGHMGGGGIKSGTLGTGQLTSGVNTSLANGDRAIDAMFNNAAIQYTNTQWLTVRASYITLNGASASWRKQTFSKPGGTSETIWWLGQGGTASKP